MIFKKPSGIWQEYQKALQFNESIDLVEKVKNNENFFLGRQWEGVNAPDLDKPVFNILKRVVNYFIAMLVSDDIGLRLGLFNRVEDSVSRIMLRVTERQIRQIMEFNRFGALSRGILRDAAVDGDGVMHVFFNPDRKSGHPDMPGLIELEAIDNTSIYFGNPQVGNVQKQPYILIEYRRLVDEVKAEMKEMGRPKADIDAIRPDSAQHDLFAEDERIYDDKVTVILKYWKENGKIHYLKTTENTIVKPETKTDMTLYPICFMNWERVKNCYHGQSIIEGLIPNQMAINKLSALAQRFIRQQAFPRVFYDETKLDRWVEGIAPIAVRGDPTRIVSTDTHNISMSSQVGEYIDKYVSLTKDLMGASDAALGNVQPDNTSAIIAVQKATAVPLELVRQSYYQFVEDFVRICVDQMRIFYGKRTVVTEDDAGADQEVTFDFSTLSDYVLEFNVDIGTAAYWSEMTSIQSLDNLFAKQLVDPVTYLESVPSSAIPNKAKIVEKAKESMNKSEEAAAGPGADAMMEGAGMQGAEMDMQGGQAPMDAGGGAGAGEINIDEAMANLPPEILAQVQG